MIYVKLISGLGNQLFQYVFAKQLAISNNDNLKIDLSFYDNQSLRSFKLNKFNIKTAIVNPKEINNYWKINSDASVNNQILKRALFGFLPGKTLFFYKEKLWWNFELIDYSTKYDLYLDGYWQHYKYFENLDSEIFDELKLKELPKKNILTVKEQMQSNPNSVAVHVRRGDYITDKEANKLMGVLPMDYYHKSFDFILNKLSAPKFYIFSDDQDWVKNKFKISADVEYVSADDDYIELDLMRSCNNQIIANSSFSWWGAFLNRNPNKIVVAPQKWVIPVEINDRIQLQFPSWIKF